MTRPDAFSHRFGWFWAANGRLHRHGKVSALVKSTMQADRIDMDRAADREKAPSFSAGLPSQWGFVQVTRTKSDLENCLG